jgi:hypothetical protein
MTPNKPAMNKPNLLCPKCGHQFHKRDLLKLSPEDYQAFVGEFSCPSCRGDIHPEDALLKFLSQTPTSEIPGTPCCIGGFATIDTMELNIGETTEIGLIGGGGLDIDLSLLAETEQPPGQGIEGLQGIEIEWYPGPILVEESVVVNVREVEDGIAFITSELDDTTPDSDSVTIAHHIHVHPSDIPQPPWVTLLSTAAEHYNRGQGLATYTLLFSAYENLLSRELERTLRSKGWENQGIEDFFREYYTWSERSKAGLKCATSVHFPSEKSGLWNDLKDLNNTRNEYIVHVDSDDSVVEIGVQELKEGFRVMAESMISVHEWCYDARQRT